MCIIGVTPLYDSDAGNLWMLPDYLDAIREAGGTPIVLTPTTDDKELADIVSLCDGFVFTGGHDLNPHIYNEEALPVCGTVSPERDDMETKLLSLLLATDKPVLGICRGLQLINAYLGGTLYQDLPSQFHSQKAVICHKQGKPYSAPTHIVEVLPGTLLADCVEGKTQLQVNTLHHQAIKDLAPGLSPSAVAPDGIIEAVERSDRSFFVGVQWHPEYLSKEHPSRRLFSSLVKACC